MGTKQHLSVIATVYNEGKSIDRLLDSLGRQTRLPDEIILCDGGSNDGTVEAIERFLAAQNTDFPDVTILVEAGANISQGRNRAIEAAQGPIIAVTDAGVRLSDDWLALLVQPWEESKEETDLPIAVAGFFVPDAEGVFQTAMAATVGRGHQSRYLPPQQPICRLYQGNLGADRRLSRVARLLRRSAIRLCCQRTGARPTNWFQLGP